MRFACVLVWGLAACATTATSSATVTNAARPAPKDPVDIARAIEAERGYTSACFAFAVEDKTDDGEVIAVREVHDRVECPGDPGVSPVIDRVRVKPSGYAERYDAAGDAWVPAR